MSLSGHRVSCQIVAAGLETGVMCALRIEGMKLSDMNALSTLQATIIAQSMNSVLVEARSGGSGAWQGVFSGAVVEAFTDYNGPPNIAFQVSAQSMAMPNAMPISPTSFKGDVSAVTILQAIADKVGLTFRNNGVKATLSGGVYYEGPAAQQIQAVASATRISYCIAMDTLTIWPETIGPDGSGAVEVSADTGMMGYPAYSQYGVQLRTLFTSAIGFRTTIKLDSQYSPAAWVNAYGQMNHLSSQNIYMPSNGLWIVQRVQHDLQSETPGGQWTTYFEAARPENAGRIASFGS
ncbi:hypothetical protein FLP30_09035 [Acetobacter vaccinii]|uniref:Uncharacterized protein n=1 Tax=Acetobacter vaccinii TaxID=2592655 RepID=A0A5C1YUF7_9PROT|nr:hypothetical protein FLP30_09035 [Acetobacter vaccinii]